MGRVRSLLFCLVMTTLLYPAGGREHERPEVQASDPAEWRGPQKGGDEERLLVKEWTGSRGTKLGLCPVISLACKTYRK